MKLSIGTRGSPLALTQTEWVAKALKSAHPGLTVDIVKIATTGDKLSEAPFDQVGGKGIFVKEIEEALLAGRIDLAVHSMKDVPQDLPAGLRLGPSPKREDPRDVLFSRFGELLSELPKGSTIGTSSPRRRAQIAFLHASRGYRFDPIRGNVETRIRKMRDGHVDAVVLAAAGVRRLGLDGDVTEYLEPEVMLPAPCQGCLALEIRDSDLETLRRIEAIKDVESDWIARAERAFLQGVGGSCNIPLGAVSRIQGKALWMRARVLDPTGKTAVTSEQTGPLNEPELVGGQLAERLLFDGGSELLFAPDEGPRAG